MDLEQTIFSNRKMLSLKVATIIPLNKIAISQQGIVKFVGLGNAK